METIIGRRERRRAKTISLPPISTSPIAVNPYNVSSLTFQVSDLRDISSDWILRQKEWPNYAQTVPNTPPSPTKKYAYYKDIMIDDNTDLCFQNVVIQKSP